MSMTSAPMPDRDFLLAERVLLLFNVLDAGFTSFYLTIGAATEANPLLAAAWEAHPGMFFALKAALVAGGMTILHQWRHLSAARTAMSAALASYGAVVVWHLIHF